MLILLFSLFIVISASLHIHAEYQGPQYRIYLFKPLTTTLILFLALQAPTTWPLYKYAIVIGLVFSLAGDIFLMLPSDHFIHGLVSFLGTHLCYIAAFSMRSEFYTSLWGLLPFLLCGGLIFGILWPELDKMKIPVMVYMLAIVAMGWQALGGWLQAREIEALSALVGAILFVTSDYVLAINRFRKPFVMAQLVVLSTYYLAQWFIALSL